MSTVNDGKIFAVKDDVLRVMDLNIEVNMLETGDAPTVTKTVDNDLKYDIRIPKTVFTNIALVPVAETDWKTAVKDPDTYYLVY